MALPAAHIIAPMLIVQTYRRYIAKENFSFFYTFLAGVAGALPDIDVVIGFLINTVNHTHLNYHRGITHSFLFTAIFLLLCILFSLTAYIHQNKILKKRAHLCAAFFLVIGFGTLTHISLDCLAGNTALLLPFQRTSVCPSLLLNITYAGILDGILVLTWFLLYGGVIDFKKLKKKDKK